MSSTSCGVSTWAGGQKLQPYHDFCRGMPIHESNRRSLLHHPASTFLSCIQTEHYSEAPYPTTYHVLNMGANTALYRPDYIGLFGHAYLNFEMLVTRVTKSYELL